ncbi:flagellar basal-body MS-ring/collar protein FliF [Rhodobacteraceae bacterium]|nr:flagellar basal-body MS-ring/collar protein FliF [Paracoccaceae bacterium]
MDRINQLFTNWSARQITALFAGLIGLIATVGFMSWLAFRPSYALLYSGLDPSASGDVLAALEQRAIPYDIRSDAIYVPIDQRDQLRMFLAGEGLPKTAVDGYEILDSLSGFSTTSQMFDAAYWRAKEGELARTIMASPHIQNARVHIANTPSTAFQSKSQIKASISVSTPSGGLSVQHAQAVRYLVSSAVSGLSPQDVAVIDEQGGLIADRDAQGWAGTAQDRTADLKAKVERLLEPHVGFGNAVVEITVETETEQQSIREKTVDPKSRVAISTQKVENKETQQNTGVTGVSVASNVPNAQSAGSSGSQSQNNEIRETTNFEISETERQIVKGPGDIKRLSVAVLINEGALGQDDANTKDATLEKLQSLVASAVGLYPDRGDILTIETMNFQQIAPITAAEATSPSILDRLDLTQIIQFAIIAAVLAMIIQFVVRPLFTSPPATVPRLAGAANTATGVALDGDVSIPATPAKAALPSNAGDRLRQMIGEREGDTVEILRNWLEEK